VDLGDRFVGIQVSLLPTGCDGGYTGEPAQRDDVID